MAPLSGSVPFDASQVGDLRLERCPITRADRGPRDAPKGADHRPATIASAGGHLGLLRFGWLLPVCARNRRALLFSVSIHTTSCSE
jgi:hypothetical protein